MSDPIHRATCFCGDVVLELTGEPLVQCYCHCASCRGWLGAPVHAATLWPEERVRVVRGKERLAVFRKTERSQRTFCTRCGGHLLNAHPSVGIDVLAAAICDFEFRPAFHAFYGERMIAMRDGLPKFEDRPAEVGGSGKRLAE